MSCVTETVATMKRLMGSAMPSAAMTEGVNMSVKPTIIVLDTSWASGTCRSSSSGMNGVPSTSKMVV